MKLIPNKVITEKDADGVLRDINYPTSPLPDDAMRIVLDGANQVWQIAYDQKDVDAMMVSFPDLKIIVDDQIALAATLKNPPKDVDPSAESLVDP